MNYIPKIRFLEDIKLKLPVWHSDYPIIFLQRSSVPFYSGHSQIQILPLNHAPKSDNTYFLMKIRMFMISNLLCWGLGFKLRIRNWDWFPMFCKSSTKAITTHKIALEISVYVITFYIIEQYLHFVHLFWVAADTEWGFPWARQGISMTILKPEIASLVL